MKVPDHSAYPRELGGRLRLIREEVYGIEGITKLAELLKIAPRNWRNYEDFGELAPAQVLLRFIELTGVDPLWLLKGEGERYRYRPYRSPEVTDAGDGAASGLKAE